MRKYTKTKVLINLLVLSFATQAYAYTCPKEFCEQTIANLQKQNLIAQLQSGQGYYMGKKNWDTVRTITATQKSCFKFEGTVYKIICEDNNQQDIDNRMGAHLCGGPMSPTDGKLKVNDDYTINGEYSYDPLPPAKYVTPHIDDNGYPSLVATELHPQGSAITAVNNTNSNGSKQTTSTTYAGNNLIQTSAEYSTSGSIKKLSRPKVKAHGFYNPANSNQVFGNFKEDKMNGKSFTTNLELRNALYPTRQCALFHHLRRANQKNKVDKQWVDRTSSTELCGKIDIDDFKKIGDAKQVMTELSATFLNLFLMSVYGPASGARVFIPMADIAALSTNEHTKQWPFTQFLKNHCNDVNQFGALEDNDAAFKKGGYGNYKKAQAANTDKKPPLIDCQIEIKDIATEENFYKIFPTNKEGVSTVADIFKKPYEDIRVKCANKKDPKIQNPTSNRVKSSVIKQ